MINLDRDLLLEIYELIISSPPSNQLADTTYEGADYNIEGGIHGFNIEDNFGGPFKIFVLNRFSNQAIFRILKKYQTLSIYTNIGAFETNSSLPDNISKITTEHSVIEYLLKNEICAIKELKIWKSAISVLQEIGNLGLSTIHWTFVEDRIDIKIAEEFKRILLENEESLKNVYLEEVLLDEAPFERLNLDSVVVLSYNGLFMEKFLIELKSHKLELRDPSNLLKIADVDQKMIMPNYNVKVLELNFSMSLSDDTRQFLNLTNLLKLVSRVFPNMEEFKLTLIQDCLLDGRRNRLANIREFAEFLTNLEVEMFSFDCSFHVSLNVTCFCPMNWTAMYLDNNQFDVPPERAAQNFVHKNFFPDFREFETTEEDKKQYAWMKLGKEYGVAPKKSLILKLC